jgi:hypothetical protein
MLPSLNLMSNSARPALSDFFDNEISYAMILGVYVFATKVLII